MALDAAKGIQEEEKKSTAIEELEAVKNFTHKEFLEILTNKLAMKKIPEKNKEKFINFLNQFFNQKKAALEKAHGAHLTKVIEETHALRALTLTLHDLIAEQKIFEENISQNLSSLQQASQLAMLSGFKVAYYSLLSPQKNATELTLLNDLLCLARELPRVPQASQKAMVGQLLEKSQQLNKLHRREKAWQQFKLQILRLGAVACGILGIGLLPLLYPAYRLYKRSQDQSKAKGYYTLKEGVGQTFYKAVNVLSKENEIKENPANTMVNTGKTSEVLEKNLTAMSLHLGKLKQSINQDARQKDKDQQGAKETRLFKHAASVSPLEKSMLPLVERIHDTSRKIHQSLIQSRQKELQKDYHPGAQSIQSKITDLNAILEDVLRIIENPKNYSDSLQLLKEKLPLITVHDWKPLLQEINKLITVVEKETKRASHTPAK